MLRSDHRKLKQTAKKRAKTITALAQIEIKVELGAWAELVNTDDDDNNNNTNTDDNNNNNTDDNNNNYTEWQIKYYYYRCWLGGAWPCTAQHFLTTKSILINS